MSEELIIRHCSPTLAGLKTGNLFSCTFTSEEQLRRDIVALNKKLVPKGLRVLPLRTEGDRALIYVYRVSGLKRDLEDAAARDILLRSGYAAEKPDQCVRQLMRRLREQKDFPHEIGLFLSYPPEDVRGFMENRACGHKCVGCWKMIRLLTASLAGEGYLNFMGNEFGHPEWIDFPREGNGWSYHYCRRQWHLVDDSLLKYRYLNEFDRSLVSLTKKRSVFNHKPECLYLDEHAQVLVYKRGNLIFAVNLNPTYSHEGYWIPTNIGGSYHPVLSSDDEKFGGFNRIDTNMTYHVKKREDGAIGFQTYLPARTAVCFAPIK